MRLIHGSLDANQDDIHAYESRYDMSQGRPNRGSVDKDDASTTLERIVAALPISQKTDQLTEENGEVVSNSANDSMEDSAME